MLITGKYTQKEIAQSLGICEKSIINWKSSEEFQNAYNSAVRKNLSYAAGKALKTQIELLDSKNDNVRYSAAKDILDRTGFKCRDILEVSQQISLADTVIEISRDFENE
jgi:DNA-binding XRE family transcriptional regulator